MNTIKNEKLYSARRAINFDLNIKAIEKWHRKPYNNAYKEIKKVMFKLGFGHRQGSGYVSNKLLEDDEIKVLMNTLANRLQWLIKCAKKIDVTDIVNVYNILDDIQK